ncbi:MAG: hypothetical protein ACI8RZ_001929 [Myxococcota bacterium]|jgi:hypothetical protein
MSRMRLEWGVDPLSPLAEQQRNLDAPPPLKLARSGPLESVIRDLKRYVRGEVSGTSFLVSGHRGSGKTTMVHGAIEAVLRFSMRQGLTRPLVVRINGPDLFLAEAKDDEPPHARVLKELAKSLARAVCDEYIASLHRHTLRSRDALGEDRFQELRQMIVQLQLTLGGVVTLPEMEGLWEQLGVLDSGVILPRSSPVGGAEEILTLWQTQEVYHQIAGVRTVTDRIDQKNQRERTIKTALNTTLDKLLPSFWGLLTGALAGAGLRVAGEDALLSATGALLTALLAAVTLNISSLSSFSITRKREYSFVPESGPAALPRLLSRLVERLHRVGLAPVFVVDELDKVDGLDTNMHALIRQLKSFISERSCFFFLTEPGYFERLAQQSEGGAYPAAHTYFGRRVFVSYTPDDLRAWIRRILPLSEKSVPVSELGERFQETAAAVLDGPVEKVDLSGVSPEAAVQVFVNAVGAGAQRIQLEQRLSQDLTELLHQRQRPQRNQLAAWSHLLLYRSRQHFGDLTRILRALQDDDGTIPTPDPPSDRAFCRILAQVALEQAMIAVLGAQPHRRWRQIALDALYHPLNRWEAGEPFLDVSLAAAREWSEKRGLSPTAPAIIARLRAHMAQLLLTPTALVTVPGIRGAVSADDALLVALGEDRYRWRVTADGLPAPEESAADTDDLDARIERIRAFVDALEAWPGVDPVFLTEQAGLLPHRPGWSEVEAALVTEVPSERDIAVLTRFDAHLTERRRALSLALTWATVLDALQSTSNIVRVLRTMERAWRFEEHTVAELEDLLRLSRLRVQGWFPAEATWEAVESVLAANGPLHTITEPARALRGEMQAFLDSLAEFSVEGELWAALRQRVEQHLDRPEQPTPVAPISWIICRLQRREVAWLLRLSPEKMSAREWSRAYLFGTVHAEMGWLAGLSLRAIRDQANIRELVVVVRWKNRRIGDEPPGRWPAIVVELDEDIPAGALDGLPISRWMLEVSGEESADAITARRSRLASQLGLKAAVALFADVEQAPKGWGKMLLATPLLIRPSTVSEAMEQWETFPTG